MTAGSRLVVGLGSRHGGDDALGPLVVDELRVRHPQVEAVECAEPTRLLDHVAGAEAVVLVDAACSSEPVGHTRVLSVSQLPEISGRCESSHGLSVRDVLALAEATGVLRPDRVSVIAVTGASFGTGAPLSAEVRDAVQPTADLAAALVAALATSTPGSTG